MSYVVGRRTFILGSAAALGSTMIHAPASAQILEQFIKSLPSIGELFHDLPGLPTDFLLSRPLSRAARGIVRIVNTKGTGGGSGILFGDGWMLTAHHVIEDSIDAAYRLVIVDFSTDTPASSRAYFVASQKHSLWISNDNDPLDITLIKLVPANGDATSLNILKERSLKAVSLPHMDSEHGILCNVVGHPETKCAAIGRDWAYRTTKPTVVHVSKKAPKWELVLSTPVCGGESGGAVLDDNGDCIGMVSSQSQYRMPTPGDEETISHEGNVVSMSAIAAKIRKVKPGLSISGLTDSETLPLSQCLPSRATYPPVYLTPKGEDELGDDSYHHEQESVALNHPDSETCLKAVGYVHVDGANNVEGMGNCFHLGSGWILTVKHVIDCPQRAATCSVYFDYTEGKCLDRLSPIRLDPAQYFSSDDRTFSYDGRTLVLDYALVRIDLQCFSAPGSFILATMRPPALRDLLHCPQHRPNQHKSWRTLTTQAGAVISSEVQAVDSRRLYYRAAVGGGASGAPILDKDMRLVAIHTNSRDPACGNPKAALRRSERQKKKGQDRVTAPDTCQPVRRWWERRRTRPEEEYFAFGSRVSAIIQDLVIRHGVHVDQIDGLQGLWGDRVPASSYGEGAQ